MDNNEYAMMEANRIVACDGYFNARPQIDSGDRRSVFEAGFERGYAAALAEKASESVKVPSGYVLVPVEPTAEMRSAFRADKDSPTFLTHTTVQLADFDSRYSAMLAAAPTKETDQC